MGLNLPDIVDVEFSIACEPEHIPVRGNASATNDDAADRECEDAIIRDLENGNDWAWCCVVVRATFHGFTGEDMLGACSYNSEKQFREPGGYFDDMKNEAFDRLLENMRDTARRLGCDESK